MRVLKLNDEDFEALVKLLDDDFNAEYDKAKETIETSDEAVDTTFMKQDLRLLEACCKALNSEMTISSFEQVIAGWRRRIKEVEE